MHSAVNEESCAALQNAGGTAPGPRLPPRMLVQHAVNSKLCCCLLALPRMFLLSLFEFCICSKESVWRQKKALKERSALFFLLCVFAFRFQLLSLMDMPLTTTAQLWQRTVPHAVGMQCTWWRIFSCKRKESTWVESSSWNRKFSKAELQLPKMHLLILYF